MKNFKNLPYVMYTFLAIQSIIFLLMHGSTDTQTVIKFGGEYAPFIIQLHEYWRLVTPIFVHIGLTHFALNSFMLYFLGEQIEIIYGHTRFFILYLISGITGNILSFAINDIVVGAGASTSLFGMFGGFIILKRYLSHNPTIIALAKQYTILVIINLIFNLFEPFVDIWGHLGGFIGGILLGIILAIPKQKHLYPIWERILSGLILFAFFLLFLTFGFMKTRTI
ncbi:MAG: rhomboid family intramembrane serine protease [Lactobacillales bacterium]|jgi:rhomboid protease GluP|nr:rhomboid family intramembrane serine protease [Lactobacillales bacterium]